MSTKNINGEYITEKEIQDKGLIKCWLCGGYDEKQYMQWFGVYREKYICQNCFNNE